MLVDTSVCIDFLRKNQNAANFFQLLFAGQEKMFISVVTVAELFSGKDCENIEKLQALENFLSYFEFLEINSESAKKAGFFRRRYSLALPDALIAATAKVFELKIASKDMKAFSKIKEIRAVKPY